MASAEVFGLEYVSVVTICCMDRLTLLYSMPAYMPVPAPMMANTEAKVWLIPCHRPQPITRMRRTPKGITPTKVNIMTQAAND